MTLGAGIALAAIWALPISCVWCKSIKGESVVLTAVLALVATFVVGAH